MTVTAANFKLIFRLKRRDYKIYQLCNTKQQMYCEAKLFQFMPQSWSFQFSTEIKGKNQEKPGFFFISTAEPSRFFFHISSLIVLFVHLFHDL